MADSDQQDIVAIEDLRRRDVAASRAGDFEKLKTLMDPECIVLPPDSEPERGIVRYAVKGSDGEIVRESQQLVRILRRQGNGSWRVYRAMWHEPRKC